MKKHASFLLVSAAFFLLSAAAGFACVGKTLTIGALPTPNDQLLAQMMAVIINERTGTTVNVVNYENEEKLYEAVKKREVNIFTENTGRALRQLGMTAEGGTDEVYTAVKEKYREQLHLVLLKPFGSSGTGDNSMYQDVPVIAEGILIEYPALPRVLNKLAKVVQERNYPKLVAAVESGDKPNQVARDFLKRKRII
ncbi:MAG: lipoprotein [Desulfobulbaceae bacterium]